jgi:AcrR family transcriptional regulator
MSRRSRAETQAETRERLLDAAEAAFAEEGFGGASLDRIAAAAGLTRGAVYSNFTDKADLFVGVIDRRLGQRVAEVAAVMEGASGPDAFVAALRNPPWAGGETDDPRWVLLYDEFRLYALRNPAAAERLARHERLERDRYAEANAYLVDQLGVDLPVDARLAAAIVLALDHSLYRQHAIDPEDVPATAFTDALDFLLRAAVALGTPRGR